MSKVSEKVVWTQTEAKNDKNVDPYFNLILNDSISKNEYPTEIDQYKKDKNHVSLMSQVMTKEIFNKYKDKKTKTGWTIARAINTGTMYPSSFVGCHAGDRESYYDFKDLFFPVIEKYHNGYKMDGSSSHVTDMDVNKIKIDLSESAKKKIISTRIRVARNLSAFPLNPGGGLENRLKVAQLMEKALADENLDKDLQGSFYLHTKMTEKQTQQLVDDHFLFRGKDKMQAASGYHQHWPKGRGVFHSKSKEFVVWINEGDHMRIISMERSSNVKRVFERLGRAIKCVTKAVTKITGHDEKKGPVFMSDKKLGMVTCCPSNLGTGMRGSVHILVPKLIKTIGFEKLDKIAREMNCQVRGSSGEHSKVVDRIDVSNWRRLGFKENELVQDMIRCANKLSAMEDEVKDVSSL